MSLLPSHAIPLSRSNRVELLGAWLVERWSADAARDHGNPEAERHHLERAHILSQPMAVPHVRTHLAMLASALRRRDRRELIGQLLRALVAAPASISGRYPVGNTGGGDVSALVAMPIPEDLRAFFGDTTTEEVHS